MTNAQAVVMHIAYGRFQPHGGGRRGSVPPQTLAVAYSSPTTRGAETDDPERYCTGCGEWWPDDAEFWPVSRICCLACRAEGRISLSTAHRHYSEAERIEARRRTWRESKRRQGHREQRTA